MVLSAKDNHIMVLPYQGIYVSSVPPSDFPAGEKVKEGDSKEKEEERERV
jgi:hypothetical protein